MENELIASPVTDSSLLPFGETRLPGGRFDQSQQLDITAVFEDGWKFGDATISDLVVSASGSIEFIGPAGYYQGELDVPNGRFNASADLNLDEDAGVYFDINEDRDSVVITWNKVAVRNDPDGERQSFQVEMIDRQDGNSEIILRYDDVEGDFNYQVRLYSAYNYGQFQGIIDIDSGETPFSDLDTRIGNTGVAGVEQVLLKDGAPFGFQLLGTDDADVLRGGPLADVIDGAGGNDTIEGRGGEDILTGGEGDDEISSLGSNSDYYWYDTDVPGASVDGGAGDDTLRTGQNNDTIVGGEGNDLINGGQGSNDLSGGEGDDIIRFGGTGDSTVTGGNGDDFLDGSFLNDDMNYYYYYGRNAADIDGGSGNDTVLGTNGADVIAGQDGNDSVLAGGGTDEIFGGDGDDILTGGRQNDTIDGGAGDDFIFGALGADVARGGEGADRFFVSGQKGDQLRILDYNYDEGDFLVLDGDLIERDNIEILYTTALTVNGLQSRDYTLGLRSDAGFQSLFTFGNEADIEKVLLRLPASDGAAVAPILFDLSDLVA